MRVILGIWKSIWKEAESMDVDGWIGLAFLSLEGRESRCVWGSMIASEAPGDYGFFLEATGKTWGMK